MGCIGSKHNQVSPSSADNGSVTGDLTTSKPSAVHTTQVVEDHGMNKNSNSNGEPLLPEETSAPYPKPISFDVPSSDSYSSSQLKFQRLKPIGYEKVTAQSLEQEQQQAQERKSKIINKRKSKQSLRLRKEIQAARDQTNMERFNEIEKRIDTQYKEQLNAETKTNPSSNGGMGWSYGAYDDDDDVMEGDATFNADDNDDWQSETGIHSLPSAEALELI